MNILFWLRTGPLFILLIVNGCWAWLECETMSDSQWSNGVLLYALQGLVLTLHLLVEYFGRNKFGKVDVLSHLIFIFVHIFYLSTFNSFYDEILPPMIPDWLGIAADPKTSQMIFIMFSCFMSMLHLACCDEGRGVLRKRFMAFELIVMISLMLIWLVRVWIFKRSIHDDGKQGDIIHMLYLMSSIIVFVIGLRWVHRLSNWESPNENITVRVMTVFLIGFCAPFGLLYWNEAVLEPVSFQYFAVYALAFFNGLILLLPKISTHDCWVVLFARALIFPFTLYFCLVFLPYIPFIMLSVFVFGIGLLLASPLFIFLIHGTILLEEVKYSFIHFGKNKTILILFFALSVLPSGYMYQVYF